MLGERVGVYHLILVAVLVAALLCGCGSSEPTAMQAVATKIEPAPQRLAFATANRLGLVEGKEIRYLATIPTGSAGELEEFTWSGDGRQLAWVSYEVESGYASVLTMIDVETGERHSWPEVAPPIRPGTRGVVGSNFDGRFTEYLPGGRSEEISVKIPPPPDPQRTEPPETYVLGAIPAEGAWLVAAENSERLSMPAASYRLFRFDPQDPALVPRKSIEGWFEPTRLDDRRVVWIDQNWIDQCRNSDRLSGYRVRAPALPTRADERSWRINRVIAANGRISVLAKGSGPPHEDEPGYGEECDPGERTYHWLALADGEWVERGEGMVELDVAEDGRVAEIEGEVCAPYNYDAGCESRGEGEYESLRFGAASLEFPDGSRLSLPAGVHKLRFSPAVPIQVERKLGSGPKLDDDLPLDQDGFGALAFGATQEEMQAATASALRFEVDGERCGTVRLADARADRELGVEGKLVDGRLTTISVTTLDVPVDYEQPPLSELQPDVSAVRPRGPRTDQGVRAGDSIDSLFQAYGEPAETQVEPGSEFTVYVFDAEGGTLNARVDGVATVRQLELDHAEGDSCEG